MNKVVLFCLLFSAILTLAPETARAYTEKNTGLPMLVELSPAEPGPNQTVKVTLSSYTVDLPNSQIEWRVNGSVVKTGQNLTEVSFNTGTVGSVTVLTITATKGNQKNTKTITIRPALVTLVWQTNSVVPKGYRGKPLAAVDSDVTIIALPEFVDAKGTKLRAEDLVYEFERDFQKLSAGSSLGKNTLKINLTQSLSKISVLASTPDGQIIASDSITITPTAPKVLFYENHPLTGLGLNRAMSNQLDLTVDEITINAEPFYFSGDNLKFNWYLNRRPFTPGTSLANQAILRRPESAGGKSEIRVEVISQIKTKQVANKLLNILFNNPKTTF